MARPTGEVEDGWEQHEVEVEDDGEKECSMCGELLTTGMLYWEYNDNEVICDDCMED